MRIKQLKERRAELHGQMKAISAAVAARANDEDVATRAMTDDERAQVKTLRAQHAANEEAIQLEETILEADRNWQPEPVPSAQPAGPATARPAGPTDPDQVVSNAALQSAGVHVEVGLDRAAADPMCGFVSPRDFLTSVLHAGQGMRVDDRLGPLRVQAAAGSDEQRSDFGEHGGFLMPTGLSPTLLQLRPEDDPVAGLVFAVPMDTASVAFPARVDKDHSSSVSGGLTVSRKPQTAAAADSRMELDRVTLHARSLFGLAFSTEEMLLDSPMSFVAILERGFSDQFGSHKLNERINGTGSGEPQGILGAPCLVSVAEENGQAATTILTQNIDKMVARQWKYGRSIWLANHDARPQLMSLVRDVGTGGAPVSYYHPATTEGQVETLLGRPLFFIEECQTLGTKGDLLNCTWSEYLEGIYQRMQSAESMHVRFVEHERAFKFWLRDDGRPWWKTPLTPRNSTATLSPFVSLDTRSGS